MSDQLHQLRNAVADLTLQVDIAQADARAARAEADYLRLENERLRPLALRMDRSFTRKCPGCGDVMFLGAGRGVSGYANKQVCSPKCRMRVKRARKKEVAGE